MTIAPGCALASLASWVPLVCSTLSEIVSFRGVPTWLWTSYWSSSLEYRLFSFTFICRFSFDFALIALFRCWMCCYPIELQRL